MPHELPYVPICTWTIFSPPHSTATLPVPHRLKSQWSTCPSFVLAICGVLSASEKPQRNNCPHLHHHRDLQVWSCKDKVEQSHDHSSLYCYKNYTIGARDKKIYYIFRVDNNSLQYMGEPWHGHGCYSTVWETEPLPYLDKPCRHVNML